MGFSPQCPSFLHEFDCRFLRLIGRTPLGTSTARVRCCGKRNAVRKPCLAEIEIQSSSKGRRVHCIASAIDSNRAIYFQGFQNVSIRLASPYVRSCTLTAGIGAAQRVHRVASRRQRRLLLARSVACQMLCRLRKPMQASFSISPVKSARSSLVIACIVPGNRRRTAFCVRHESDHAGNTICNSVRLCCLCDIVER